MFASHGRVAVCLFASFISLTNRSIQIYLDPPDQSRWLFTLAVVRCRDRRDF